MNFLQLLYRHFLVIITLSYIAGIFISAIISINTYPYFIAFFLALAALFFKSVGHVKITAPLIMLFFVFIGIYSGNTTQMLPDSPFHVYNQVIDKQEAVIVGKIKQQSSFNGEITKLDVEAVSMSSATHQSHPVHGVIRYSIEGEIHRNILPGEMVAIRAKLKRPQKYLTPGSFDYPAYLAQQDIYITGFIKSPLHLQLIQSQKGLIDKIHYYPETLRVIINRFIDTNLENEKAAIYKALLTGDKSSLSPTIIRNYRDAGCIHILAISGIHMSLLGVFIFTITFWVLRRSEWLILHINTKKTAAILCIIPLIFYTLIAGAKTPVLRSLIMSLVVIFAICYGRKHSVPSLLACASLIILAFSPGSLFTPSFQLSFAAVISISAAIPYLKEVNSAISHSIQNTYIEKSLQWLISGIAISAAATFGTAPLVVYHFNRISQVGVLANLIVEPVICLWSLTIGFIAVMSIFIFPAAAKILFSLGGLGISFANEVVSYFASLSFAAATLPTTPLLLIILYYFSFALLLSWRFTNPQKRFFSIALFVTVTLVIVAPLDSFTKKFNTESVLRFIDVGQGSCTLIEMPGGKRILIDGGAITSPRFDIGERVIAPFLLKKGITKIDQVIITHPDSDHYSGITYILRHFNVDNLWVSHTNVDSENWLNLMQAARENDIAVSIPGEKFTFHKSENFSLHVIATQQDTEITSRNDNGLILKYRHGDFSALFPGDISSAREKELTHSGKDLNATLLLAAHHGSVTSNSYEFLKSVQPELVIVSSGKNRTNSFPSPRLHKYCNELGIKLLPIHENGTITIRKKKGEYSVNTLHPTRKQSSKENQTSVKSVGGLRKYLTNFAFSTQFE